MRGTRIFWAIGVTGVLAAARAHALPPLPLPIERWISARLQRSGMQTMPAPPATPGAGASETLVRAANGFRTVSLPAAINLARSKTAPNLLAWIARGHSLAGALRSPLPATQAPAGLDPKRGSDTAPHVPVFMFDW